MNQTLTLLNTSVFEIPSSCVPVMDGLFKHYPICLRDRQLYTQLTCEWGTREGTSVVYVLRYPFTPLLCQSLTYGSLYNDTNFSDVIMSTMTSQITGVSSVQSTVCSGADQNSASLAFLKGIHPSPVDSPHKGPVTQKMFPFDGVIMLVRNFCGIHATLFIHPSALPVIGLCSDYNDTMTHIS